ncbi:MAG: peptidylprolyl isomerase [Clostridium sp.]|nr:peptidylprolyl isomerase [Clostridium sp.]MCM1400128.1 peptidylprolyl isomerase [Clostridium sp.]MCM1460815.1 peptidylprolyl isomerase [Bacteroides sp.]
MKGRKKVTMKKNKLTNKVIALGVIIILSLGLTCCGKKEDANSNSHSAGDAEKIKVMVIGDYDIYMDEMMLYIFQTMVAQGATSDNWDDEIEQSYKDYILSQIRESKIIYDVAIHNDVELNDRDMEVVKISISNFKNVIPQSVLDQYGVSDEVIERVFQEQAVMAKFENDIKNDMGQTINDDMDKAYQDTVFHTYYYMVFPTVEINENDEPKTDDDGNYVYVSDEEKVKVLEQAKEAAEKINAGTDCKEVAKEYGVDGYSMERSGYQGAYTDDLNDIMSALKENECTEPIEDTLGYALCTMLVSDDTSLKSSYIAAAVQEVLNDEYSSLRTKWLSTIAIDVEKDMEGTVWTDLSLKDILLSIEKAK